MFQVLAIPSAHKIILGHPMVPLHILPPPRPRSTPTMGRGWTTAADNRVMGQFTDEWGNDISYDPNTGIVPPNYDASSVYFDTTQSNISGGVDVSTMDNNASDTLVNLAGGLVSQGVSAAVTAAQKALGITPVYHPSYSLTPVTTTPKWLVPAAIAAGVLVFAMSGRKRG